MSERKKNVAVRQTNQAAQLQKGLATQPRRVPGNPIQQLWHISGFHEKRLNRIEDWLAALKSRLEVTEGQVDEQGIGIATRNSSEISRTGQTISELQLKLSALEAHVTRLTQVQSGERQQEQAIRLQISETD